MFRRTEDLPRRIVALLGGGLFVSPYAMHYDAALLAPAAALMLARRTHPGAWIATFVTGAILCCAAIPHWGAAAVTAYVLLIALGGQSKAPDAIWEAVARPLRAWRGRAASRWTPDLAGASPLVLLTERRQDRPTS